MDTPLYEHMDGKRFKTIQCHHSHNVYTRTITTTLPALSHSFNTTLKSPLTPSLVSTLSPSPSILDDHLLYFFSLSLSLSVFLSPTISIHFVFSHNDTYHSHDNLITLTHNYMSYSRISMNSMSINLLCQLIWRYM